MEKYMPAPNADPHDVAANIYENKNLENALTKSAHQDEMI